MASALVLLFDKPADDAVRSMWANLEARGLRSLATRTHGRHQPHVSLLVADRLTVDQARTALAPTLGDTDLELRLGSLAVFPGRSGVLYLGVVPTRRLLGLHHDVHRHVAHSGVETNRHYLPNVWVPHCTLAQGLTHDEVTTGVRALKRLRPLDVAVRCIALVDIDTGATTDLVDLPRNASSE